MYALDNLQNKIISFSIIHILQLAKRWKLDYFYKQIDQSYSIKIVHLY